MTHNVFTNSDAECLAHIRSQIDIHFKVAVLIDRDANLYVGPEKTQHIGQRIAAHGEQLVGSYTKAAGALRIAQDILERKGELLLYGAERMEAEGVI